MEARNRKLARIGRSHPHVDGNQPRTFHPGWLSPSFKADGPVGGTATAVSDMPASVPCSDLRKPKVYRWRLILRLRDALRGSKGTTVCRPLFTFVTLMAGVDGAVLAHRRHSPSSACDPIRTSRNVLASGFW